MAAIKRIWRGRIVTPHEVLENGVLLLEGGRIAAIDSGGACRCGPEDIDATGMWVLPGIIDCHSDAIERELQPRPNSRFPLTMAFYELERKLAGSGITTIFHSLSLFNEEGGNWLRSNEAVRSMVDAIQHLGRRRSLIKHKIHIRFEINNIAATPMLEAMLLARQIDEVSFMDHTPGQGQFRDLELQKQIYQELYNLTEGEVNELLARRCRMATVATDDLQRLADLAYRQSIPLASHDDDSTDRLALIKAWHAAISEFPVDLEVALAARQNGLYVVMGAPNVILGRSHSNNLSALQALQAGAVDILCSDYYPPALLYAVFQIYRLGYPMHQAVNMVSLHAAEALGLAAATGSIEAGKAADLLLIREYEQRPVLEKVLVDGKTVYQLDY